jgi:hypothetical protein
MASQPHHGEVFEAHRPTGEQGDYEGIAKKNRPPPRRPFGGRFGFVHQAPAEVVELADGPQAGELIAHRSNASRQSAVELREPVRPAPTPPPSNSPLGSTPFSHSARSRSGQSAMGGR